MNEQIYLSIILPAYLEEENLRILLPRVKESARKLVDEFEVIVVDTTRAMDGTPELCEQLGVTYLNRTGGENYGDAIRTGIKASSGEKVVFMDADGSHPPAFIAKLFERKEDGDVIIASRYIKGGHTENKWILQLMSRIVNLGYSIVLGLKCKDVSNSFRLYNGEMLRALTLECNNFDIVEEILYKLHLRNRGMKIIEVPFSFKQRMFGETKRNLPVFIMTYIFTLIKLRFMR